GSVVVVEAGVHAAELRQTHRHVAVVEDDRDGVALADRRRDAAEMRHRHREHDYGVDVALALEQPLQMPLPAWRHPALDGLERDAVAGRHLRARLLAAE